MYMLILIFTFMQTAKIEQDTVENMFTIHYENMPIQIYGKFYRQKLKIFRLKTLIFFSYFCSKHRLWVLVRTASQRRF